MSLWAYSMKTATLSIGSSLAGWKYSETAITITPRGSATAPKRMVIASSPPTCRLPPSRASMAFSSLRGPDPQPHVRPTPPTRCCCLAAGSWLGSYPRSLGGAGNYPVLLRHVHVTRNNCILLLREGMYVPQGTKLAE